MIQHIEHLVHESFHIWYFKRRVSGRTLLHFHQWQMFTVANGRVVNFNIKCHCSLGPVFAVSQLEPPLFAKTRCRINVWKSGKTELNFAGL